MWTGLFPPYIKMRIWSRLLLQEETSPDCRWVTRRVGKERFCFPLTLMDSLRWMNRRLDSSDLYEILWITWRKEHINTNTPPVTHTSTLHTALEIFEAVLNPATSSNVKISTFHGNKTVFNYNLTVMNSLLYSNRGFKSRRGVCSTL